MNLPGFPQGTYHVGLCVNDECGHNTGLVGRIDVSPAEDKEWLIVLEHVHDLWGRGWPVEYREHAVWFRYQKEAGAHDELLPLLFEEYQSHVEPHVEPHVGNLLWDRVTVRGRIVLPFLTALRDSGRWFLQCAPIPVFDWWEEGPHQSVHAPAGPKLVKVE